MQLLALWKNLRWTTIDLPYFGKKRPFLKGPFLREKRDASTLKGNGILPEKKMSNFSEKFSVFGQLWKKFIFLFLFFHKEKHRKTLHVQGRYCKIDTN